MTERNQSFRVGLFVLVTTLLFAALILFVLQARLGKRTANFYIRFEENVKGLLVGSRVNFQGISVGSVEDVRFDRGQTQVLVGVDLERCVIQKETQARIDRAWVTGQVTIELEGYDLRARDLAEGETILARPSVGAIVSNSIPEVVETLGATLEELRRLSLAARQFLNEDNALLVKGLLKDSQTTLQVMRQDMDTLTRRLDQDGGRLLASTQKLLDENGGRESGLADRAEGAFQSFHATCDRLTALMGDPMKDDATVTAMITELRGAVRLLGQGMTELNLVVTDNRERVRRGLTELNTALAEVRGLVRELRATPSALLFGRDQRERAIPDAAPAGSGK
jgi:phospholipid/cholesterol/gamma-HCH transport system substrate-binding protein